MADCDASYSSSGSHEEDGLDQDVPEDPDEKYSAERHGERDSGGASLAVINVDSIRLA